MALAEMELARFAVRWMRSCSSVDPRHTFGPKVDPTFRVSGQSVEIFEIRQVLREPLDEKHESPIAKATFVGARGAVDIGIAGR